MFSCLVSTIKKWKNLNSSDQVVLYEVGLAKYNYTTVQYIDTFMAWLWHLNTHCGWSGVAVFSGLSTREQKIINYNNFQFYFRKTNFLKFNFKEL